MEHTKRVFAALTASALLVLLSLTVFTSNTSLTTNPAGTVRALAPTNNFDQFVIVLMENHDLSDIYGPATYMTQLTDQNAFARSEERRVGKECRSRWSP